MSEPRTCIRLQGLSKAELNGCRGEVSEIDVAAGRYQVHLQNGKQIKVGLSPKTGGGSLLRMVVNWFVGSNGFPIHNICELGWLVGNTTYRHTQVKFENVLF